jgi:tetraacyldisaccharide 4'-kinase
MPWSPGAELAVRWWSGRMGAAGAVLDAVTAPLEWAYRALVASRNMAYDRGVLRTYAVPAPVISVGNLSVGGTGKTPVAAWLLRELQLRGRRPALLHGGYADDEPELHRRWSPGVPVVAGRDRVAAAAAALEAGADVLVLDDGFQHRRLARDLDLLLVSCESWDGRRRLLPRGGWREPPGNAARASLIAITRRTSATAQAERVAAELARFAPGVPQARLWLAPAGWRHSGATASPPAERALAVAAVADPGSFVDNARAAGAVIHDRQWWRDHHRYEERDASQMLARAGDGPIVTTEKDWVKLERLLPSARVWILVQEVRVEAGASELGQALDRVLRT